MVGYCKLKLKPIQIFSRLLSKKQNAGQDVRPTRQPKMPELDEFLLKRDYAGAISLLEFKMKGDRMNITTRMWLGHCYFRAGDYQNATNIYENMLNMEDCPPEVETYLGCCHFYLGNFNDARDHGEKGPKSTLQNRLLFHVAHKLDDEKKLMLHHQQLKTDVLEDQLSLASMHFMRLHYNEASKIYSSILEKHLNMMALNVYISMCYYQMEYYDVAQKMINAYLKSYPDSPAALNLTYAITYRTYQGNKSPSIDLDKIPKSSLYPSIRAIVRHNSVVFRDGDGALQNLPSILDQVPEARLNMIIYYVKQRNVEGAFRIAEELTPVKPMEFLVKAIAYAMSGVVNDSKEHLDVANSFFKMVGESSLEADTIAGRQAMAAHQFLSDHHDEALFYYESIAKFMANDNTFLFNYAQCLLFCNRTDEAEQAFLSIGQKSPERNLPIFKYHLAKCLIRNGKPEVVWDMIKQTPEPQIVFTITRILANDGFRAKAYFYSGLAYDSLSRMDPSPDYHQGLLCSASGLFSDFVRRKKPKWVTMTLPTIFSVVQQMSILCRVLERCEQGDTDKVASVIKKYAVKNGIELASAEFDFMLQ